MVIFWIWNKILQPNWVVTSSGTSVGNAKFSASGDEVAYGFGTTNPYRIAAFPFTAASGYGAMFANPATLAAGAVAVAFTPLLTYTITANARSFTLSGIAAGLRIGRGITATTASFALTGVAATLTKNSRWHQLHPYYNSRCLFRNRSNYYTNSNTCHAKQLHTDSRRKFICFNWNSRNT